MGVWHNPDLHPCSQAAEQRVSFRHHESRAAQSGRHSLRRGKTVLGGEFARMRWQAEAYLAPQVRICGGAGSLMPKYPQVWEKNRKLKSFNLSALEKHGPVYEDGEAPGW